MVFRKEVYDKFSSIGISERYSEGVNEKPLIGLRDKIKYGDKLWTSVGYPELIYGGFTEEKSGGKSEDFLVGLLKVVSIGLFDITMIGLYGYFKIKEEIGCMEGTLLGI